MAEPKSGTDYFLKVDGVDGESQDSKHKNEIQILSYESKVSNSSSLGTGGGGGTGHSTHGDFIVVKNVDKASPKLFEQCATGKPVTSVNLTGRKAGGDQQEFLIVTMSDVLVSSVVPYSTGRGDRLPEERVTFNYSKIELEYKEQKPDGTMGGSTKAGYNVKEKKKT